MNKTFETWLGRLIIFLVYPFLVIFLLIAVAVFLVFAWFLAPFFYKPTK